ncbi:cyclodeaminase/cyclohydrolase family protein [Thermoactinomyces mirandus]|uniref:Cyclodeaminase/cyclohydrolase family protein n=1 Tax=Thermoactinomyces mirandus TaxID=2756294 RepID=A0A7W2ASA3_9BACL|nr:cyclodeaminase/cyclohydrolase family protein [Thermoactinomyces mirandus]MBA4602480.1 cyclodeaminase/cyclohydrolase family protein [Thermoactinomyces mirandus]
MLLKEHTITDFVDITASKEPAPGGGSIAALSGALSSALTAMVNELTKGKKKYAKDQELVEKLCKEANEIREQFVDVMDRDTKAYNKLSSAFSFPKETDEEKKARSAAIQEGLVTCIETPMEMMELCVKVCSLVEQSVGHTNSNCASDLGVAALMLNAAVKGAWLNVLINLGSLKDRRLLKEYYDKGSSILEKVSGTVTKVYLDIEAELNHQVAEKLN